jgi:hypothetical protein
VIRGECEDILPLLGMEGWQEQPSVFVKGKDSRSCLPNTTRLDALPALDWPQEWITAHHHHHHRFDIPPQGAGAEVESSRGCPYSCTFCAKEYFRGYYRKRETQTVLREIDNLLAQGVSYVYFVDELFLPDPELLDGLDQREMRFGIQTRIDLLSPETIARLGRAGCVSLEAGVESITDQGRALFGKRSRMSTPEMVERLVLARKHIPFVQANLLKTEQDDREGIIAWRRELINNGVWANDPVPLFPYPGSPEYRRLFGEPDTHAWERAHAHYLERFSEFCDLQESSPTAACGSGNGQGWPMPRGTLMTVLMTTDTVGGVWHYSLELARGLGSYGIRTVLATMGPPLSAAQRRAASAIPGLQIQESRYRLEWMPDSETDIQRAGEWLLSLERRFSPDVVHVNGFAHGSLAWKAPCLVVAHSCVLSWWLFVKGEPAPQKWDGYARFVCHGLAAADLCVFPTRSLHEVLSTLYGPFTTAAVIYNGRNHMDFPTSTKTPLRLQCRQDLG